MIGWIILCMILFILAVILLTPVQVQVSCQQGGAEARLRYGLLKVQLYPIKRSERTKPEKKKKNVKKAEKSPKKKPKAKINREQIFYAVEKLPPILERALQRTKRHITIVPLYVELLLAGQDPADTAILYGRLTTALAAGLPVLQRTVRIREQDIRLYPDFTGNQIKCAAEVGVSIRPWDMLVIGLCAGASLLKWFLGFRKLASPPPAEMEETTSGDQEETTGTAA